MPEGDQISCGQFANYLISQEPVYDELILADIRPASSGLMGFYSSGPFDAYSGSQHTFDRVNNVFPNLTHPWSEVSSANCITPSMCDPVNNKIGMGWTRETYGLKKQAWDSEILCFDAMMLKTRAKTSLAEFITGILQPASKWISNDYIAKEALRLASKKIAVTAGLPEFTYTWEGATPGSEGFVYLLTTEDPTGKLTAPILQSFVDPLAAVGGAQINESGITGLQLHTDKDTYYDMVQGNPTLNVNYRIMVGDFAMSAKEYYQYGMRGYIGDYLVKILEFPLRFNKVSDGRYQYVAPYVNIAATEGIKSIFNLAYQNAQYQISYSNNPMALQVQTFNPSAVNPMMPYLIRDYGGKWRFAVNNLGADSCGRPIDNSRMNKGKFIADFQFAVKPVRPEWLYAIFHKRSKPCITIVDVCDENPDPGYPAQDYNSANAVCPSVFQFTAVFNGANIVVNANTITCNGNPATHTAISVTTAADLVTALTARVPEFGTWSVADADTFTIQLTDPACESVVIPFVTA